jgi:HEAT repeat protein
VIAAALIVVLDPDVLPEFARFADSTDADVRQNLAIAYGQLGGLGESATLAKLLCDRVWWVRYRAGQGLLKLKGMDDARLGELRAGLKDPYALDMLRHVIAEAGVS